MPTEFTDFSRLTADLVRLAGLLDDHPPQERLAICAALYAMAASAHHCDVTGLVRLGAASGAVGYAGRDSPEHLAELASALLQDVMERNLDDEVGPKVNVRVQNNGPRRDKAGPS